jgi:broad specificity phosphatase PhoE
VAGLSQTGLHKTTLILVRHSLPEVDPETAANEWRLSEEGRRRSREMAEQLAAHRPEIVVTSQEPKAQETGEIIAGVLNLPWETAAGLHEHRRTGEFFSQEQFQQQVREFFARPSELVFGLETAEQAGRRFSEAVSRVVEEHAGKNILIVAHGTVMTLFITAYNPIKPVPFWQQLKMPDFVVLTQPSFTLPNTPRSNDRKALVKQGK